MVSPDLDDISSWQYDLPAELIASRPAAKRDDSRLMIVRCDSGHIEHGKIRDLPDLLSAGDLLVFNNTKVLPARLFGFRTSTQGQWEGLFLEQLAAEHWKITGQTRGKLTVGESLTLIPAHEVGLSPSDQLPQPDGALQLKLVERFADGTWRVLPNHREMLCNSWNNSERCRCRPILDVKLLMRRTRLGIRPYSRTNPAPSLLPQLACTSRLNCCSVVRNMESIPLR